jgi:glycosyltransferase involved in cell wall biosynthesis
VSLDADLIHVTAPGPLGWRGAGVARKLGIPIVASFHTDLVAYVALSSRVLARAVELPTRRLYGRADVVTAPTPRAAQALARVLHSDSGAIRIVPQGVDPARFARAPAARRPGHQSRILTVSRLSPEKRLDLLIDSVRRLGDARLDVVGDGPLRQRLSRSAPDVELHGALTGNDLVAAFRSADIFALASPTETCGQVLLEAQAAGLACVVSPSGGARDAVLPGQTAVVARENSPAAFAEALATALADRERLGREARRFALAQTWERTAEALTSCYADAVAVAVARSDSRGFRDRPG